MIDTFKKTIEDVLEGLNFFDFSFFISGFAKTGAPQDRAATTETVVVFKIDKQQ